MRGSFAGGVRAPVVIHVIRQVTGPVDFTCTSSILRRSLPRAEIMSMSNTSQSSDGNAGDHSRWPFRHEREPTRTVARVCEYRIREASRSIWRLVKTKLVGSDLVHGSSNPIWHGLASSGSSISR